MIQSLRDEMQQVKEVSALLIIFHFHINSFIWCQIQRTGWINVADWIEMKEAAVNAKIMMEQIVAEKNAEIQVAERVRIALYAPWL